MPKRPSSSENASSTNSPEPHSASASDRYAAGASIRVKWTDGPLVSEVKTITDGFEGAGFDGMIDLKYHKQHWLRPDGTTLIHWTPGTQGSRGVVPEEDNRMLAPVMPEDAELVTFGADFVFATREISNHRQRTEEAITWIYQKLRPREKHRRTQQGPV